MTTQIYMHGQILGTHSFYLKAGPLHPDEYSELSAKYFLPGGETGTAATVLASLGVSVKIDGTQIGTEVAPMLRNFYKDKSVDLSSCYFDPNYAGLMDYVIVDGLVRTPMGFFQSLYQPGAHQPWNMPKEDDIATATVCGIDPFFLDATKKASEFCVKYNKPYVTIDCAHTEYLHQHAAINIVSRAECLNNHYKGKTAEEAYKLLTDTTDGLVIITRGGDEMIYGRRGQPPKYMKPFKTEVKSTLGAGDTFKAGCLYALLNKMSDDETVRFASACSSVAISRFPLPLNPPTLEEVNKLLLN